VHELPPELAAAKIRYADFKSAAQLRRNMHMLSFALDFCSQVDEAQTQSMACLTAAVHCCSLQQNGF
jgi:hypothetical protein